MPVCRTCTVDKAQDAFYYRKDSGRYRTECKICMIDGHTCRALGITRQELLAIEIRAGNKCECCGREVQSQHYTRLVVDHCHTTGQVRGLLCSPCNTALGLMDDDPMRLRQAADYLESRSPSRSLNEGVE